jgi:hypothetical protein
MKSPAGVGLEMNTRSSGFVSILISPNPHNGILDNIVNISNEKEGS